MSRKTGGKTLGISGSAVKGDKVAANKNVEKMNSGVRKMAISPVSECITGKNILSK